MNRIALALGLLALAGCVSDRVTGERKLAFVQWSVEEEVAMGRGTAPVVESQFDGPLVDAEAHAYLSALVLEMAQESVRKDDFEFSFQILDSSIPNAFALPGGHVYITRGLLQELDSEGQFVSVLGHELGHVEHQHAMFAQSRGFLARLPSNTLGRLNRAVLGSSLPGRAVGLAVGITELGPALFTLKYDRDQEIESDRRGAYFADAMGYDPIEAVRLFEVFQRLEAEGGASSPLTLFSTHPANDDRIAKLERLIDEEYAASRTAAPASFRTGGEEFARIVTRLRERAPTYAKHAAALAVLARSDGGVEDIADALTLVAEAIAEVPGEPLFHTTLGELEMLTETGYPIERFRAAVRLYDEFPGHPGHWKPRLYLGILELEAENVREATQQLETAVICLPQHALSHFFLGVAYEADGRSNEAVASYRRVLDLAPSGSEFHREAKARLRGLE